MVDGYWQPFTAPPTAKRVTFVPAGEFANVPEFSVIPVYNSRMAIDNFIEHLPWNTC
jgi:hypothetical protein